MSEHTSTTGASALITGGASGLGEAVARRRAAAGDFVVIVDRNAEVGERVAASLGAHAAFVQADITDPEGVQRAIDAATAVAPLRAAVSCAGIGTPGRVLGRDGAPMELEQFRRIVEVNLIGTFNVLRLAAAAMHHNEPDADGQRGVIINTASVAAYEGQIGQAAYSASKGGVVGLTLPAARDLTRTGVRVLTIAPGLFDTPLLRGLPQPAFDALSNSVPFPQRLGRPDEFAHLVDTLIASAYLNGEVIRIDGALRLPPR